jgi:hypothetical protein
VRSETWLLLGVLTGAVLFHCLYAFLGFGSWEKAMSRLYWETVGIVLYRIGLWAIR